MAAQPLPIARTHGNDDLPSLAERAQGLSARFSNAKAEEILSHAVLEEFKGRIALVSSFGAESAGLLHLVSKVDRTIPIIFLDTEKHFAQTVSYRKKVARAFGLTNIIDVKPNRDALTQIDPAGDLWKTDPDACCAIRKVEPLKDILAPFDAWITGRKQFHGGERITLPVFEANTSHIKVNPLIRWTPQDVEDYLQAHQLPTHPLVAQGYPSIGCWPCTQPVAAGEDVRAGRWRGARKTECGIHTN